MDEMFWDLMIYLKNSRIDFVFLDRKNIRVSTANGAVYFRYEITHWIVEIETYDHTTIGKSHSNTASTIHTCATTYDALNMLDQVEVLRSRRSWSRAEEGAE